VHWQLGRARCAAGTLDWKAAKGYLQVPEGVAEVYVRVVGAGSTDAYVDDIELKRDTVVLPDMPKVSGAARRRVEEKLDRGVVALRTARGVYVGWRLLKGDSDDIAFDVFRCVGDAAPVRANAEPVRWTTDFLDRAAPADSAPVYIVRPAGAARSGLRGLLGRVFDRDRDESSAPTSSHQGATPYVSIKLNGDHKFQKIGIADLDGDGRYDYVIKQPHQNIDPWEKYWYKSPDTYQLEAYRHNGEFMWRIDLGWSIERGIWYSPYIVYDLDGDGKAEVAAKLGEGDPRDPDGRVTGGPEWLVVFDGLTGVERARVPWPSRDGFENYNLASRNQISIAYLDGKTPCLLALRGTYGLMKVDAYEFTGKRLRPLWTYNNEPYGRRFWGQGAHFTHAVDVDGDGRDEVALGSVVLDDTGAPLWSTGLGHPDHSYWGDLDPHRPGMEVYFGIETRNPKNGTCMVDAATGQIIWGLDQPTKHIHGTGLCADIDPTHAGVECYGADADGHELTDVRFMRSAAGEFLRVPGDFGFGPQSVYWDADLQREVLKGGIRDYDGGKHADRTEGSIIVIADILGDWREEIVTSVPGELRIYSTTLPATDRRVCLMQDPIYRLDVAMTAMGYTPVPTTSYCLEATAPGLNLTAMAADDGAPICRVVVSAPLDRAVAGTLELECDEGTLEPSRFAVNVAPGQRFIGAARFSSGSEAKICTTVRAELRGYERPLRGQVDIKAPSKPLTGVPMIQGETFTGQGGGEVKVRDDKPGVIEKAISHWDAKGHWLEWGVKEAPGKYQVVVRYSAAGTAKRHLTFDGQDRGVQQFPGTGGFGDAADTWDHAALQAADGKPLVLELTAAEHVLRLENTDGNGLNLDYLALVPVK
jgi:rhamnogalacturonan endolyase